MQWDDFRVGFDDDGTLRQRGRNGWREPVCAKCGEPVRWVLDMASFVHMGDGSYALAHARCAWTKPAFDREKKDAPDG